MPIHRVFRRRTEKVEAKPGLEVLLKDELDEAVQRLKVFSENVKKELNVIDQKHPEKNGD